MKKIIVFASLLFLVVSSYGIAVAAPPLTAPPPLFNVKIFSQPFILYDSGYVSGPLNLEVATTGCSQLLAFVFNKSPIGAVNLPVTLNLEFVYPPLLPPACTGSGEIAVSLLTLTANSASGDLGDFSHTVIPPCLRVTTVGSATSYAVILLCN